MKYAFIALIAIYLVVYGCSPDSSEKATDSHETTATATLDKPHQAEEAAVAADPHEPAAPSHDEEPVVAAEVVEEPAVAAEVVEEPVVAAEVVEQAQPVDEKQQAAVVAESQVVVMPCGRTMARADIPKNAPCLKQQPQTADKAYNKQDLNAVMQKMVETTNQMVIATRQLVIATQEVLEAGKEILEAPEETEPVK